MNLQEKFNKLEKILLNERDSFYIQTGTPFILLIYDPYKEYECRRKIAELINILQYNDIKSIEIPLNIFIFKYLEKYNKLEEIFEKEKKDKEEFIRGIRQIYSNKIKAFILNQIKQDTQVIFLTRIGSIYPFYYVSKLVESLVNEIKIPTVFFYPGSYFEDKINNEEQVFFFGKYSSDSTYRTFPIA